MENKIKCTTCLQIKDIAKFSRNVTHGKKYGYRKICNSCRTKKYQPWITKPLGVNKYDSRFKWKTASYDEKMKHLRLVFDSNVIKKEGCWGWQSCKDKDGYGDMTFEKRPMKGHRVSWFLEYGPIPNKLCVLHRCDNRYCTNPKHLFLGTPRDNFEDMVKKGRRTFQIGSECKQAVLNERKVRNIKKLLASGIAESKIAKKYKVTRGAISDIKRNRNWKHVKI